MQSGVSDILSYLGSSYDYGDHPRHSPRTFPLGLLAPRCLGLARFLALRHCGAGARAPAVWGKEGILPPASPRLGRARPTGSANPLSRFQDCFRGVAFASDFCFARLRRRSSFSHGRPSGNVRGLILFVVCPTRPMRTTSRREGGGGLPY